LNDEDLNSHKLLINDGAEVASYINSLARTCRSPYTDGFTQCTCKHQLYVLKCFIEDVYKTLPEFPEQEKEWEQTRLVEILKK
jgi:hypothetical protein